jgi:hypothetical protein
MHVGLPSVPAYEPVPHATQLDEPADGALRPAGHAEQFCRPVTLLKYPCRASTSATDVAYNAAGRGPTGGHSMQSALPPVVTYRPAGQSSHVVARGAAARRPGAHAAHTVASVLLA